MQNIIFDEGRSTGLVDLSIIILMFRSLHAEMKPWVNTTEYNPLLTLAYYLGAFSTKDL